MPESLAPPFPHSDSDRCLANVRSDGCPHRVRSTTLTFALIASVVVGGSWSCAPPRPVSVLGQPRLAQPPSPRPDRDRVSKSDATSEWTLSESVRAALSGVTPEGCILHALEPEANVAGTLQSGGSCRAPAKLPPFVRRRGVRSPGGSPSYPRGLRDAAYYGFETPPGPFRITLTAQADDVDLLLLLLNESGELVAPFDDSPRSSNPALETFSCGDSFVLIVTSNSPRDDGPYSVRLSLDPIDMTNRGLGSDVEGVTYAYATSCTE